MNCLCCKSEAGHEHGTAPNEEPRRLSDPLALNLGIYMDEDKVTVGTITPRDTKEPEIILEIPAEITFFNEKIMIGGNSEKNRMHENHFRVYDLIKETLSPSPEISLTSGVYPLHEEEILALFFEQLLSQVKSAKSVSALGNVVLTLPFNVSSLEKERIKAATKAAGLLDIRIISSLLTTAIAFAREKKYYKKKNPEVQSIFVSQYLRQSFSMAVVKVGPGFIATDKCISSINLNGGQDKYFEEYHAQMFENKTILSEKTRYVYGVYKKGVRKLESCCNRIRHIDPVVIKATPRESTLDNNYTEIFRSEVQFTVKISGPLAGACLLASRFLPGTGIPSKLIVCDASLTNLIVSSPISSKKRGKIQNKNYCPGVVFEPYVKISPVKENFITLKEEYFKHEVQSTVGQYRVTVDKGNYRNDHVNIQLLIRVDRDGIFAIGPIFPSGINGSMVKINGPSVNTTDSFSDFNKLRSYYKALKNDTYSPAIRTRLFRLTSIPEGSKEDLLESAEPIEETTRRESAEILEEKEVESDPETRATPVETSILAVGEDVNTQESYNSLFHSAVAPQKEEALEEDDEAKVKRYIFVEAWSYDFAMQKLKGKNRDEVETEHARLKEEAVEEFKQKIEKEGLKMKDEWIRELNIKLGYQLLDILNDTPDAGLNKSGDSLNNDENSNSIIPQGAKLDIRLQNGISTSPRSLSKDINSSSSPTDVSPEIVPEGAEIKKPIGDKNESLSANVDEEISPELIPAMEEALDNIVKKGVLHHQKLMYEIADKKLPYKDTEIITFHKENLEAIKSAIIQIFRNLPTTYPLLPDKIMSSIEKLENAVNSNLTTYLKRYETSMDGIIRKVKDCTLVVENLYDEEMESYQYKDKTASEVRAQHEKLRELMLSKFEREVRQSGVGWHDTWKSEVEEILSEKLKELLEECMPDATAQDSVDGSDYTEGGVEPSRSE